MANLKREIYIKLDKFDEISSVIANLKKDKEELVVLMNKYKGICVEEGKCLEAWKNYLSEIEQKLERVVM